MRSVEEWVGASADSAIPDRVKSRILSRQMDNCDGCGRALGLKLKAEFDHRPALINGGQNRESMIVAVCHECHGGRTQADVAEKAIVYRQRIKHLGIKKSSRPMPGSKASKFKRKMDGSVVLR